MSETTEKKEKEISFVRRIKEQGIYSVTIGEKPITITDRGVYTTGDPLEIETLKNDPEIKIYSTKEDKDLSEKLANTPAK
jgi:hypothetical protein